MLLGGPQWRLEFQLGFLSYFTKTPFPQNIDMDWIITIPAVFFIWIFEALFYVVGPIIFWLVVVLGSIRLFYATKESISRRDKRARWARWRAENDKWVSGVG